MLAFCAQTYVYRMARSDPTFQPSASIPLQAYGNPMGAVQGETLPTHASVACDADGYRQEALLFVDEAWADTAAARGGMSTFLWRPCVKFQSTHYKYVRDPGTKKPRLVQRDVGADPDRPEHFGQPTPHPTAAAAAGLATLTKQPLCPPLALPAEDQEEDNHSTTSEPGSAPEESELMMVASDDEERECY